MYSKRSDNEIAFPSVRLFHIVSYRGSEDLGMHYASMPTSIFRTITLKAVIGFCVCVCNATELENYSAEFIVTLL